MNTLYFIANLAGVIAFAIGGARNVRSVHGNVFACMAGALITTFGGGMLFRDLIILRTIPAVFSNYIDVSIAIAVSLIVLLNKKLSNLVMRGRRFEALITLLDAFGLGAFICCGVDKGFAHQLADSAVLLCGILTGIGGGVISSIVAEGKGLKCLSASLAYRMVTILCTLVYFSLLKSHCSPDLARSVVIILTTLLCIVIKPQVSHFVINRIRKAAAIASFMPAEFGYHAICFALLEKVRLVITIASTRYEYRLRKRILLRLLKSKLHFSKIALSC